VVDLVQPLKFEHSATGGTETDEVPTAINEDEDYASARGFAAQHPDVARDDAVRWERTAAGDFKLRDKGSTGAVLLSALAATKLGRVKATLTVDLVTNVTEYTDASQTVKVMETDISYTDDIATGLVEKHYDAAGVLDKTLTGTVVYDANGLFERVDWV